MTVSRYSRIICPAPVGNQVHGVVGYYDPIGINLVYKIPPGYINDIVFDYNGSITVISKFSMIPCLTR